MVPISPGKVRIEDYTYNLPDEMIARFPKADREDSKLLVYNKGEIGHTSFHDIVKLSEKGQFMVFNNTRVIQARIIMYKHTGARIEIFLLEPLSPAEYNLAFGSKPGCRWKCMTGNKKKWKGGELEREIFIEGEKVILSAKVVADYGSWQEIEFNWDQGNQSFGRVIENGGLTPIPPYLERMPVESDRSRYQTVYSRHEGSVAAPTAGLHFTDKIIDELKKRGTLTGEVTLHVGAGTFQPVKSATAGEHPMHAEHFSVSAGTISLIKKNLGKITVVGTTSMRTIESLYWLGVKLMREGITGTPQEGNAGTPLWLSQWEHLDLPADIPADESLDAVTDWLKHHRLQEIEAKTELMIIPGYRFRIAGRLITNFHQPGSTLLLLIASFVGNDWRRIYEYALSNEFRFLSYGDSSLLIP